MSRKRCHSNSERLFPNDVCAFCGTKDNDEVLYGKFIVSDDISLHMNCVFFASGLTQRGDETQGFSGFLLPDIEIELRRGKKLFCSYCRKRGATVGCSEIKCKKSFHLNCGRLHNVVCQFFNSFTVYCKEHSPKQTPIEVSEDLFCYICCEGIAQKDLHLCLYSPCCKKNFFHKVCLQKYALSAGVYFFKCPLCNNSREFVKEMEFHGICLPEKDASWELEENAYEDLYLTRECDANSCLCQKGRKYCSRKQSGWSLLPCTHCGSHARHRTCEGMKLNQTSWLCEECICIESQIHKGKSSNVNDDIPGPMGVCAPSTSTSNLIPVNDDDQACASSDLQRKVKLCESNVKESNKACPKDGMQF